MRVVMPYVRDRMDARAPLHLAQRGMREGWTWGAIDVSGDSEAYWRLLCELWASGDDFTIIEHDIEIHAGVMPAFSSCASPWCVFPYWGQENLFRCALGCVRFRKELTYVYPTLIEDFPVREWDRMDSQLATFLHRKPFAACEHEPLVKHHHDYTRALPRTPRGMYQRYPGGDFV